MSDQVKQIKKTLDEVFPLLSEAKKEYLLGFGDGLALAKTAQEETRARDTNIERESA